MNGLHGIDWKNILGGLKRLQKIQIAVSHDPDDSSVADTVIKKALPVNGLVATALMHIPKNVDVLWALADYRCVFPCSITY